MFKRRLVSIPEYKMVFILSQINPGQAGNSMNSREAKRYYKSVFAANSVNQKKARGERCAFDRRLIPFMHEETVEDENGNVTKNNVKYTVYVDRNGRAIEMTPVNPVLFSFIQGRQVISLMGINPVIQEIFDYK